MFGALLVLPSSVTSSWWGVFFSEGVAFDPVSGKPWCTNTCCTQFMTRSCNFTAGNAFKMTLLLSISMALPLRFSQVMTVPFLPVMPLKIPLLTFLSTFTDTDVLHPRLLCPFPYIYRNTGVEWLEHTVMLLFPLWDAAEIFSSEACGAVSACNGVEFCNNVGFLLRLSISACWNFDGIRLVMRWWVFGLPWSLSSAGSRRIDKGSSLIVLLLRTLLTSDKCHLDSKWSTDNGIFCCKRCL